MENIFEKIDPEPLASASIGQVHKVRLNRKFIMDHAETHFMNAKNFFPAQNGDEQGERFDCVIKVQHPRVEQKLRQDIASFRQLLRISKWLDIFRISANMDLDNMFNTWQRNVLNELHFGLEARNSLTIGKVLHEKKLQSDGGDEGYLNCFVPNCLILQNPTDSERMNNKFFIMRYVRGVKMTELTRSPPTPAISKLLAKYDFGLKSVKYRLCDDIFKGFAQQIFISGIFNADPHPGNIFICDPADLLRNEVLEGEKLQYAYTSSFEATVNVPVPVLLDFGLCGRFDDKLRLAISKMVYYGINLNVGGLMTCKYELGVRLYNEQKLRTCDYASTGNDSGKNEFSQLVEYLINHFLFLFRDIRDIRTSRKELKTMIEKEQERMKTLYEENKFEPPFEYFPPETILLFRCIDLLRGVCSSLGIQYPILRTFERYAKQALIDNNAQQGVIRQDSRGVPFKAELTEFESKVLSTIKKYKTGMQIVLMSL